MYLKLNDFGCDPLGEDPVTASRREATLAAIRNGADVEDRIPVLSRRLDNLSRAYLRGGWEEVPQAQVFDQTPVQLTVRELEALQALDGGRKVGELLESFGDDRDAARERLRHLAEREVIDLMPAT
jgi:hypothetical protein